MLKVSVARRGSAQVTKAPAGQLWGLRRGETRRSALPSPFRRTSGSRGLFTTVNPRQIIVEFYLALERATGEGNIHKARAAARAIGLKFDNRDATVWLKPFVDAASERRVPSTSASTDSAPVAAPVLITEQHHGSSTTNGLARDNCIPSIVLASEPSVPQHKPKQPRLHFVPPGEESARAMLEAVWERVEARVGSALTKTAWKARNKRSALEMAQAGLSAEAVLAAHERLCGERGDVVYTLKWVHEAIIRGPAKARRPFDPKHGCDCDLDVGDCVRLHGEDGSPRPLTEIIAEQKAAGVYSGSIAAPLS